MTKQLPFRSALITGASSGIGEAMVRLLAASKIDQVVVARRSDLLDALAAQHPGVEVLTADLTTADGVGRVERRVRSETEPIDLVVNNAGFGTSGDFHELDPDRLDDEVRLNVGALTRLSHAALAVMIPRRRGYLLNVSSVAGFQPAPRLAVYAATKAYVTSLTESLHGEVRGTGVKVTALCPGFVATDMTDWVEGQVPKEEMIQPEDIAEAVRYLLRTSRNCIVPELQFIRPGDSEI